MLFYTKHANSLFGLCELFASLLMVWIYGGLIVFGTTNWITITNDYLYIFFGIPLIFQICIATWLLQGITLGPVTKEKDGIQKLHDLLDLCITKSKSNVGALFTMLCIHRQSCTRPNCLCHDLSAEYLNDNNNTIHANLSVYTRKEEVPFIYLQGYFMKTLKILVEDLSQQFQTSDEFNINLAELYFYFFGNHYYALEKVMPIQDHNPSVFIKKRIYNLKRNILAGLESNYENYTDREKTITTIDYLELYRKFIEHMEDLIELTIKFWSILLKEKPTAQELNKIGRLLFESKQEIIEMIEELSDISQNNIDVLLRQGLLLRNAFNDKDAAEQIFYKIVQVINTSYSYSGYSKFNIFNAYNKVMFMITCFTNNYDANIIQVNAEFEKGLGYKLKEIADHSIKMIMPSVIANCHPQLIQKFFNTMESDIIGKPESLFLKCKNGLFLPCKILKKIIPRMNNIINNKVYTELQVATFIIQDKTLPRYARSKKLTTSSTTGAILCDGNNKVIGITRNAMNIFKLNDQNISDIYKNVVLDELFSKFGSEFTSKSGILNKDGIFIKFTGVLISEEINDELNKLSSNKTLNTSSANSENNASFLWMRYFKNDFVFDDSLENRIHVLLISEINQKFVAYLKPAKESHLIYECKSDNSLPVFSDLVLANDHQSHKNSSLEEFRPLNQDEAERLLKESGDQGSISSENHSQPSSSNSKSELSGSSRSKIDDMFANGLNSQVPTSIKRLAIGIVIILTGTISLICIFLVRLFDFIKSDWNVYFIERNKFAASKIQHDGSIFKSIFVKL